ncbi:hypothetical protein DUI87_07468 [Hirundo rustica rustica]|uniref:Bromo domain-containing protein n=1 Tax=Hirundo rustica rustica TaxID=333673 RepID=A0A3M0KPU6_HIRRU|nr:hypothetical protein DUI87_07468 [Hirundo rustica rustica]
MKIGGGLAGVEQMQIDGSVQFDGVGGLSDHISSLKEMVIFPLLYPEIFERLKIEPPRGCLFYGPPGTGKTLLARALANECSQGHMRVTFFMRKGAECLSKWIGESERQLRLLFEQAYQMRPSIIFFDEIDALAPVRSDKQDQIHSSVVGTLLALMDGLASRGEVVVIGATNRLDAIDPALRRPGRFEREFRFSLPNKEVSQIRKVFVLGVLWVCVVIVLLRENLGQLKWNGFQARKEIFKIHTRDWNPKPSENFLEELAEECVGNYVIDSDEESPSTSEEKLTHKTPDCKKAEFCTFSRNPRDQPTSYRPRFLLIEEPGSGQASDLAAAIIHSLEKFPIFTLDTPTLFASTSPDETCVQIKALFNNEYEEVFRIPRPTCAERRLFFEDLVMKQAAQPPALKNNTTCQPLEVLPVAPPPKPRKLTEEEIRQVEEQEEDTLRELRIYLRDVAQRLFIDKRFKAFTKPVGPEKAPNDKDATKQPMDLLTVLSKIDMRQYLTARDFLKDIDLICSNALEYSLKKRPADKSKRKCKIKDDSSSIAVKRKNVQFALSHDSPTEEDENVFQGQQKNGTEYESESEVLDSVIAATENVSISRMERLYALLSQCIYRHREDDDKTELVKAMKKEIATLSVIHDFSIF